MCVGGEETEELQNMKYLGAKLSEDGTMKTEQRVRAAAIVTGAIRKKRGN